MLDDITGQGGRFRRTMQLLDNTDKKEVGNACFPLIFLGVVVVLAAYIGPNRTVTTTTWERQYCNYRATIIKHMFYFVKHRGKQIGLNLNGRTFQSFLHQIQTIIFPGGRMKRSVFVILLILLISACAAPAASSPPPPSTPDSTAIPSATATVTPTETLLPTETPAPSEILARDVMAFLEKSGQFSDEKIKTELYKITGQTTQTNELGLVAGGGEGIPVVSAQEILLGGKVEGNYAYLFLGTQDRNGDRFVHIGVFPLTYEGQAMDLTLYYHDSLIYQGVFETTETLSGGQALTDFITTHRGVVVVPNIAYGRDDPTLDATLPEKQRVLLKFSDLTNHRGQGIANRLFVIRDTVGLQTADSSWGTEEGIFTLTNPLTAGMIDSITRDFNADDMVVIGWMYLRK